MSHTVMHYVICINLQKEKATLFMEKDLSV